MHISVNYGGHFAWRLTEWTKTDSKPSQEKHGCRNSCFAIRISKASPAVLSILPSRKDQVLSRSAVEAS